MAMKNVKFMPGAERLVMHLHKHSIPMAISTGSDRESYSQKTAPFGDFFTQSKYFSHSVLAGDDPEVKCGKTYPDPFVVSEAIQLSRS